MARSYEASSHGIPAPPDVEGWRHWGDGLAGRMVSARLEAYDSSNLQYRDVLVNASGELLVALAANPSIDIGTVDQGAAGAQAWPVSVASLPLPTGASTETTLAGVKTGTDKIPAGLTVTSTRLLTDGSGVTQPVSGTFWQTTQPVSIASMPSTPVTGPLTDTQLRATAIPVSLASLPAIAFSSPQHVIVDSATLGTVAVSGSLARSWTLGSGGDSVAAVQSGAWTDDVTDRAARLLGHVTVDNASIPASQSGSWALSGSDGLSTLAVSARQHNGYTHLYVRDAAAIGVLSEVVHELRQLRKELHV